jgi:endonuclease YncB( thermonuclease family)
MRALSSVVAAVLGAITIVDGDTVRMDGVSYRLLGFDTPETYYARCARERQWGNAASARLKELIEHSATRLEVVAGSCKWRRKCAKLFIQEGNVADIMISEGHAVPYNGRGKRKNWCAEESV